MKRFVKSLIISTFVLLLSGCSNDKEVVKTCTLTSTDNVSGYKMNNEYKIYGTGKVIDKVETTETVTSDNKEILDTLENLVDEQYKTNNEIYGGYTYKIERDGNKLVSRTTIDYSKMDLDKFVEDNTIMKSYVNSDNKLLIEGIVKLYETMGAVCK